MSAEDITEALTTTDHPLIAPIVGLSADEREISSGVEGPRRRRQPCLCDSCIRARLAKVNITATEVGR